VDDRYLLVANHPYFLEIDAERRQIFRDKLELAPTDGPLFGSLSGARAGQIQPHGNGFQPTAPNPPTRSRVPMLTRMTQLPHAFKRIRLELARSKEFPNGSPNHGYEFIAPLDSDAHIDAVLWQKYRENCRVSRFWGDGEEIGYLVHKPGGPEHARWVFD
jgi:hypothetical protein